MAEDKAQSTIRSTAVPNETLSPRSVCEKSQVGEIENDSPYSGEIEGIYVIGLNQAELAFYSSFTPQMRRTLNRKIDIRLVPMLAMLYLISNLDRANIGNAKIEGMGADLRLTGTQYNVALAVFFISYIIFDIPSNAILKQLHSPSYFLGACTLAFGIIMCMHGVVKDYAGLAACRFMLGVFEAGFLPASIYLCSAWYHPSDLGVRMGAMFCTGALSGAFSGLLAAGITQMNGVGGYEGWRWIFIIEGAYFAAMALPALPGQFQPAFHRTITGSGLLLGHTGYDPSTVHLNHRLTKDAGFMTLAIGVATLLWLIDLPSPKTSWLSPAEVQFLELQRKFKQGGLNAKGSDVEGGATGFRWIELKMVVTNWKSWVLVICLGCQAVGVYGAKFHLPTLTQSMGFSSTNAQLLSAPPYMLAAAACIYIPHLSDRRGQRGYFILGCFGVTTVGWAVVIAFQGDFSGSRLAPGYIFTCLSVVANYPGCALINTWASNNTAPAGRRAMMSGFLITVANIGGIIGSFMFLDNEAPVYNTGNGISLAVGVIGCVCTVLLQMAWRRANTENGKRTEEEVRLAYSDDELLHLGDRNPLFKYVQ